MNEKRNVGNPDHPPPPPDVNIPTQFTVHKDFPTHREICCHNQPYRIYSATIRWALC
jgi:hypothetical protein